MYKTAVYTLVNGDVQKLTHHYSSYAQVKLTVKFIILLQMTMPSGMSVTARYSCYSPDDCLLDVTVFPLVEDAGYSEGLCGNNNDNRTDDRTPAGSSTVDTDSEPVAFTASYMYVGL